MNVLVRMTLLALLLLSGTALAVIETYEFSDPELEERYRQLSTELRCPKCQNQNIADSNAPISQDLRKLLYQQLEAGANDEEILDYMVARYGEFVRYRPRFSGATAVLWLAPLL
jgi:cytochrome c-type biogenesis protein CcmH